MGVPFEALLPYGIIIGVRIIGQSLWGLQLTYATDVWRDWLRSSLRQALRQRWQEGTLEP
jgi:hypothetical protein